MKILNSLIFAVMLTPLVNCGQNKSMGTVDEVDTVRSYDELYYNDNDNVFYYKGSNPGVSIADRCMIWANAQNNSAMQLLFHELQGGDLPFSGYLKDNVATSGVLEGKLVNGKWDGKSIQWHKKGTKYLEAIYINGVLDGLSTRWYENGNKFNESIYVNGVLQSERWWSENGTLVSDTLEDKEVELRDNKICYIKTTNEKASCFVKSKTDGKKSVSLFVNGLPYGRKIEWYPSGTKLSEWTYHGSFDTNISTIKWEESGKEIESATLDYRGVKAETITWHANGRRASERKTGESLKEWDDTGRLLKVSPPIPWQKLVPDITTGQIAEALRIFNHGTAVDKGYFNFETRNTEEFKIKAHDTAVKLKRSGRITEIDKSIFKTANYLDSYNPFVHLSVAAILLGKERYNEAALLMRIGMMRLEYIESITPNSTYHNYGSMYSTFHSKFTPLFDIFLKEDLDNEVQIHQAALDYCRNFDYSAMPRATNPEGYNASLVHENDAIEEMKARR